MYFPLCLSGQKTSNQLQCSTVLINLREEKFTICSRLNGAPQKGMFMSFPQIMWM